MEMVPATVAAQRRQSSGAAAVTNYMSGVRRLDAGPQAYLADLVNAGASIGAHFHDVDQFQLFVRGTGRLGRWPLTDRTFHYADAFTTYGPIVSEDAGVSFFTLRCAAALGHYHMPGSAEHHRGKRGRNIVVQLPEVASLGAGETHTDVLIPPHTDGLTALRYSLGPGATAKVGASEAGSRYLVVTHGALRSSGEHLETGSLLHLEPGETLDIAAGSDRAGEGLLLQFPRPTDRIGSNPAGRGALAGLSYFDNGQVHLGTPRPE